MLEQKVIYWTDKLTKYEAEIIKDRFKIDDAKAQKKSYEEQVAANKKKTQELDKTINGTDGLKAKKAEGDTLLNKDDLTAKAAKDKLNSDYTDAKRKALSDVLTGKQKSIKTDEEELEEKKKELKEEENKEPKNTDNIDDLKEDIEELENKIKLTKKEIVD